MPCYVGLDASKKTTSICVMDPKGAVLREGEVETTPTAIIGFLRGGRLELGDPSRPAVYGHLHRLPGRPEDGRGDVAALGRASARIA